MGKFQSTPHFISTANSTGTTAKCGQCRPSAWTEALIDRAAAQRETDKLANGGE